MIPSSLYHGLLKAGDQQELTKRVLSHCPCTRRLYLLGLSLASRRTESLFTPASATLSHISHYYLLVVVQKPPDASLDSLQDTLENNLQHWVSATAIMVSEERFTAWIMEGHPFACAVQQKGLQLFSAGEALALPSPPPLDQERITEQNHRLYKHTSQLVSELLAGAQLYHLRTQYALSAFLLHQAAEQALRTLVIVSTGYRPSTHSLDKLLRYGSMCCHPLSEVFARNTEKEKQRFSLLSRAYIDARYRDDYSITAEDLRQLTGKVQRLQSLFEQHCRGAVEGQHLKAPPIPS